MSADQPQTTSSAASPRAQIGRSVRAIAIAAALLLGAGVSVAAVCGGHVLHASFGARAAGLAWMIAGLGAAIGLARSQTHTSGRLLLPVLLVLGCGIGLASHWIPVAQSLAETLGLHGYLSALMFLVPLGIWGVALGAATARLCQAHSGALAAGLLGAAAGYALVCPAWPLLGTGSLLLIAGALHIGTGILARVVVSKDAPNDAPTERAVRETSTNARGAAWLLGTAAACFVVIIAGWSKLYGASLGEHIVTSCFMLATLTGGAALGAALGAWWALRVRDANGACSVLLSLAAVAAGLSLVVAHGLPDTLLRAPSSLPTILIALAWGLGPTAVCLGACLPFTAGRSRRDCQAAIPLGLVAGGVLSLAAAGVAAWDAPILGAGLLAMCAVALQLRSSSPKRALWAAVLGLPLLALAIPAVRSALGRLPLERVIASRSPRPEGLTLTSNDDLVQYTDWFGGRRTAAGYARADGPVTIRRGHVRSLDAHAQSEVGAALIGLLCRPAARTALVASHGREREVGVLTAAHLTVTVAQPRIDVDADGLARRTSGDLHDHLTPDSYDVIVAAPGPLWLPSAARLATPQGWQRVRRALTAEGVFVQPVRNPTPALVAQFRAAFEDVWMLRFNATDLLVGSTVQIEVSPAHWQRILKTDGVTDRAQRVGLETPGAIWKHLHANAASLDLVSPSVEARAYAPRFELDAAWKRLAAPRPDAAGMTMAEAFPPEFKQYDQRVITPWMHEALVRWTNLGMFSLARAWERAWPYGEHDDTLVARARIALARNEITMAGRMAATLVERGVQGRALRTTVQAMVGSADSVPTAQLRATRQSALHGLLALAKHSAGRGDSLAYIADGLATVLQPERAKAVFEEALAVRGEHEAPPGTQAALAKLLLSGGFGPAEEKRALRLLERDPATYNDPDLLNLLVREASLAASNDSVDSERVDTLEKALESLSRSHAMAAEERAWEALLQGDWPAAAQTALEGAATYPRRTQVWLLALLASRAVLTEKRITDGIRAPAVSNLKVIRSHLTNMPDDQEVQARMRQIDSWFDTPQPGAVQPPQ